LSFLAGSAMLIPSLNEMMIVARRRRKPEQPMRRLALVMEATSWSMLSLSSCVWEACSSSILEERSAARGVSWTMSALPASGPWAMKVSAMDCPRS